MDVLLTGLGLGREFGVCEECNINFSWLFHDPAVMLWADNIIIPKNAFENQLSSHDTKWDNAINLILDIANDSKILKVVDIESAYKDLNLDFLYEAEKDREQLIEMYPRDIIKGTHESVPGEIFIKDQFYCEKIMASINASLFLSNELNANCLFSKRDYQLLKYKFNLPLSNFNGTSMLFDEIFSPLFPNEFFKHNYAFSDDEQCTNCANENHCKASYMKDIENRMYEIIELRNRDELCIAKDELQNLIDSKEEIRDKKDLEELKRAYRKKQMRINDNIKRRFPKIKRWTNIGSIVGTSITVGSACNSNAVGSIVGGTILGVSQVSNLIMDQYESRNKWVGFVNKSFTIK